MKILIFEVIFILIDIDCKIILQYTNGNSKKRIYLYSFKRLIILKEEAFNAPKEQNKFSF